MEIEKKYKISDKTLPNIPVEFVILHYTAQSLKGSLNIFLNSKQVSCHLLIDTDGQVYEMIPCWDGVCKKAFHAGKSFFKEPNKEKNHKKSNENKKTQWENIKETNREQKNQYENFKEPEKETKKLWKNIKESHKETNKESEKEINKKGENVKENFKETEKEINKQWKNFNAFSIGIELINLNGNLFPFTDQQYQSLFKVLNHLKNKYPALESEKRILGHEQIAGFRGKKDPGVLFDWPLLFQKVYKKQKNLNPVLTKKQAKSINFLKSKKWNDKKAKKISLILEKNQAFWLKKIQLFITHLF